jgi:hypothetical protein
LRVLKLAGHLRLPSIATAETLGDLNLQQR